MCIICNVYQCNVYQCNVYHGCWCTFLLFSQLLLPTVSFQILSRFLPFFIIRYACSFPSRPHPHHHRLLSCSAAFLFAMPLVYRYSDDGGPRLCTEVPHSTCPCITHVSRTMNYVKRKRKEREKKEKRKRKEREKEKEREKKEKKKEKRKREVHVYEGGQTPDY